jgi:hypothetical protein
MKTWKNIGAAEGWVRLTGGALLILVGLTAGGWIRWLGMAIGLALVLTAAIRH